MPHESLYPEDATLLCAIDPAAPLQIGALCFFEAAGLRHPDRTLRLDDLRTHVEARLEMSPRFRQRIATIAFDAARPMWLDDDHFDVANHVKSTTLPAPGGVDGLRSFVADLLSSPFDEDRPLWEFWLVDGIHDERVALVLRVHHVMADGLSLFDAALLLLDAEPRPHPDVPGRWKPEPAPGADRLLFEALAARTRHQMAIAVGSLRGLASMIDPRRSISALRSVVSAVGSGVQTAPTLPMNGQVGPKSDFLWTSLSMPELLEVKRARGTTLNDVVLAVVTGALRRNLGAEESARLAEHPPRVLVPVGALDPGVTDEAGNAFSMVVADLPVRHDDPLEQLAEIHAQMKLNKRGSQSSAASSLFSVIDLVPLPVLRRLAPVVLSHQPFVNLAVTNIPGSRLPLYLLGSQMTEVHPIITGVGNIALIVGVLSHVDQLGVGITVDPGVVRDADGFLEDLRAAAADLIDRAR